MYLREARLGDEEALAQITVASWRSTYKDLLPSSFLNQMTVKGKADRWREKIAVGEETILVAMSEDQVIMGYASGGESRYDLKEYEGELYAIYILKEHQGKGIGKRLYHALTEILTERNLHGLLVWVLSENPYKRFYEALGGVEVAHDKIELGGDEYAMTGYGWKD